MNEIAFIIYSAFQLIKHCAKRCKRCNLILRMKCEMLLDKKMQFKNIIIAEGIHLRRNDFNN